MEIYEISAGSESLAGNIYKFLNKNKMEYKCERDGGWHDFTIKGTEKQIRRFREYLEICRRCA